MKHTQRTKRLVEASLMVALATVLSLFKLIELPYGGSITLASMLPILLLSYRHGVLWGLGGGTVYAALQLLLGLNNLSYFTTWQSVVAVILLDYILAFTLTGLGGVFRRIVKGQHTALLCGAILAAILRYLCHVIAGATVWAGLSIPTEAALLYSLGYNATYMLPEGIVLAACGYCLGTLIDFGRDLPTRATREERSAQTGAISPLFWLVLGAGAVIDAVLVFSNVQHPETGAFDLSLLVGTPFTDSVWLPVCIVSALALLSATALQLATRRTRR